jgi:DNA topoisomerase I
MFESIRRLFILDPLEDRIAKAIGLQKAIEANKAKGLEFADGFLPMIDDLRRNIQSMEKFCDMNKSDSVKLSEGLILLNRFEDKFKTIEHEYYNEIGKLRKLNKGYESQLLSLRKDKELDTALEINKLEDNFLKVLDCFKKGEMRKDMFLKSMSNYLDRMKNNGWFQKSKIIKKSSIDITKKVLETFKDGDEEIKICSVDADKVRQFGFVDFVDGGHHYVDDDYGNNIPDDEIWIDSALIKRSKEDSDAIMLHEKVERHLMKVLGYSYDDAYEMANEVEKVFRNSQKIKKSEESMNVESKKVEKSIDVVKKAFKNGLISKDILLKAVKNYIEKAVYADNAENRRLKRVGKQYGGQSQDDDQSKDESEKEEPENNSEQIEVEQKLGEHAEGASTEALERAVEESDDDKVKEAAQKELDKRSGEATKENKQTGLNSPENEWIKEFSNKYKLSRLPLGIPKDKVQVNEEGDVNSHYVMKWVDPKTGKEQRAYTKEFLQKNADYKWDRIKKIDSKDIEKIKSVASDALKSKDAKEQQIGAILSIISNTGLRIGSRDGFNETQNRGVSTLHADNIKIDGDKVSFEFTGKSYKNNTAEFEDSELAKVLTDLKKSNSDKEFIFDKATDDQIRDYFHDKVSKDLKIKDMRTYIATDMANKILEEDSTPPPPLPKKGVKKIIQQKLTNVYKKVSEQLNNTPSMAKNSYIHPKVIDGWIEKIGAKGLI